MLPTRKDTKAPEGSKSTNKNSDAICHVAPIIILPLWALRTPGTCTADIRSNHALLSFPQHPCMHRTLRAAPTSRPPFL